MHFRSDDEVKVYYNAPIDREFDDALTSFMESQGYYRWASGMNFVDGVRDLCFDKVAIEDDASLSESEKAKLKDEVDDLVR